MRISKLTFGLAALALVAAPAIAQSSLTPSFAPLSGDEEAAAGGAGLAIGLFAAFTIVGGVIVAADNDDTTLPVSP